jgi:hypothetical protein
MPSDLRLITCFSTGGEEETGGDAKEEEKSDDAEGESEAGEGEAQEEEEEEEEEEEDEPEDIKPKIEEGKSLQITCLDSTALRRQTRLEDITNETIARHG